MRLLKKQIINNKKDAVCQRLHTIKQHSKAVKSYVNVKLDEKPMLKFSLAGCICGIAVAVTIPLIPSSSTASFPTEASIKETVINNEYTDFYPEEERIVGDVEEADMGMANKNIDKEDDKNLNHHALTNKIIDKSKKTQEFTSMLGRMGRLASNVYTVKKGQTLSTILNESGVSKDDAHNAFVALRKIYDPKKIRIGQEVNLTVFFDSSTGESELLKLSIEPSEVESFIVKKAEDRTFTASVDKLPLKSIINRKTGVINVSLLESARNAGVPTAIAAQMIKTLSNAIDFRRDIRKGDSFEVLYETEQSKNAKITIPGKIMYISLTTRGQKIALYSYTDTNGFSDFYDEKGHSVRKTLSKNPLNMRARITSPYGWRRHPVLGYKRMHWGVDYGVRVGTAVYAGGDGYVAEKGRKGSYGKYLRIRHNSRYSTAYAHLNGWKSTLRVGQRVKKGDLVAYSGNTGRSTGPHLHYEIIDNGVRVNPLKVRIATGGELNKNEMAKYKTVVANVKETNVAMTTQNKDKDAMPQKLAQIINKDKKS